MPGPAVEGMAEHTGVSVRARAGFVLLSARGASRASGEPACALRAVADIP
jgi:hypothetical protein